VQVRRSNKKPVVLVLGSGWAAHSCIKVIDTDACDVIVVSPRNHFCFTPMLPSTAVGTVEFRSLLEPIRVSNEFVGYLEADAEILDLESKTVTCSAVGAYESGYRPNFTVPYDMLVVAVGEQSATFGVPGVTEHCSFMKEVRDTVKIRRKLGE
jgi:NADH:ubiquinone reductase (non-electrogenic)